MANWQHNLTMAFSTAAGHGGARKTSQPASTAFLVRFFEWFGELGESYRLKDKKKAGVIAKTPNKEGAA